MMSALNRSSIVRAIMGVCAAPVIVTWAIVSFLPLSGVLVEGASTGSRVGDALFFATGFGGLFALYLLLIVLAAGAVQRRRIMQALSGRLGLVAAYATVWLVGYAAFRFAGV